MNLRFFLFGLLSLISFADDLTLKPEDLPRLKPTEARDALGTMVIKEGFRAETVAAEPLVVDPVALCFDEFGRMFVVEMRDYSERRAEHLGTIRMLEDTNGDGIYDKATVFADNLPWPTGVICYNGGIFVIATPDILYFKDTDGNGKADVREIAFTGFGEGMERLNVQALANSLTWGPDNRIHGANGGDGGNIRDPRFPEKGLDLRGRDFSFDPATRELRAESGGGQYGLSFDNWGRKYICSNSNHARTVMFDERYVERNPFFSSPPAAADIALEGPAAEVFRLSPDERWRVIRTKWRVEGKVPGPIEGGGRPSGYFTGATGITVFTGDAWGGGFEGDLFVADCGSNLIHHKKVHHQNGTVIASRPDDEQTREFLASRDNWFRPVQFENSPDGNLYFPDMYREVIEHPWSLPEQIKKYIDLNAGNDRGRIYRIVRGDYHYAKRALPGTASRAELVNMLDHPNGWYRDTAARLIYEAAHKGDGKIEIALLHRFYKSAKTPWGKLHALRLLDSLAALQIAEVSAALIDPHPALRVQGLQMAEKQFAESGAGKQLVERAVSLTADSDVDVLNQLALSASFLPKNEAARTLELLIEGNPTNSLIQTAVLLSSHHCAGDLLVWAVRKTFVSPDWQKFLKQLAVITARSSSADNLEIAALGFAKQLSPGLALTICEPLLSEMPLENARATARATALIPHAALIASDLAASINEREEGIKFLSFAQWSDARGAFEMGLEDASAPLMAATISAINMMDDLDALKFLAAKITGLPANIRIKAIEMFCRRATRFSLLDAVLQNVNIRWTPSELALVENARARLSDRGRDPLVSESRQAVYQKFVGAAAIQGDAAKGSATFQERCAACHQLKGIGTAVGPDLQSVKTNSKEIILSNIIDPSREIAPKYQVYEAELNNGDSATGFIWNESENSITLKNAANIENVLKRVDLKRLKPLRESIMPMGLEQGLDLESMASLLEFITN